MSQHETQHTKRARKPQAGRPAAAPSPEKSEQDLPLKIRMRRLFWAMGSSTVLDVKLRAYVSGDARGAGWQEFTDLDVLGVAFAAGGHPRLTIADCKTVTRRAIERMFWVRGVADFFSADEAFMVRSSTVPMAARALSNRLNVGVLDPDDYTALAATFPSVVDLDGVLGCLFDLDCVRRQADNTAGLDRRLEELVDFLRFDYWIYEPYRNLTQVVAHLAFAKEWLDPANPRHVSIFFEAAWRYAFALTQAAHHVRTSRMGDVPTAVRTYVAGGELALREKMQLAELLHKAGIAMDAKATVLPPYAEFLAELLTRLLRRPSEAAELLRYGEYVAMAVLVGENATVATAFGPVTRPVAAKLLADVCGFLVTTAGLRSDFRSIAREYLVLDLTGGAPDMPPRSRLGVEEARAEDNATGHL